METTGELVLHKPLASPSRQTSTAGAEIESARAAANGGGSTGVADAESSASGKIPLRPFDDPLPFLDSSESINGGSMATMRLLDESQSPTGSHVGSRSTSMFEDGAFIQVMRSENARLRGELAEANIRNDFLQQVNSTNR
jgi:hypothetical protein